MTKTRRRGCRCLAKAPLGSSVRTEKRGASMECDNVCASESRRRERTMSEGKTRRREGEGEERGEREGQRERHREREKQGKRQKTERVSGKGF